MDFEYEWDEQIGPILYLHIQNRKIGLCICHQRKDRSLRFFGLEKYLCARCIGVLLGGITGIILIIFQVKLPVILLVLFSLPMIIDGFTQLLTSYESKNYCRIITGLFFGFSLPQLIDLIMTYGL